MCHQLAQRANLDTRPGKKPPVSLADKRAAWREELTTRFGSGAVAQVMQAVPGGPAVEVTAALASAVDHESLAERAVAAVAARRSTWTAWNIRAEVERLLRSEIPFLPPQRHQETADAVTAIALSPAYSISAEAPSLLDEPPEPRRSDGEATSRATGRTARLAGITEIQRHHRAGAG